jgi:hypothetical protein
MGCSCIAVERVSDSRIIIFDIERTFVFTLILHHLLFSTDGCRNSISDQGATYETVPRYFHLRWQHAHSATSESVSISFKLKGLISNEAVKMP